MSIVSKVTITILLALTAVVLVINFQYLYTAPVANSCVWWSGDETWLMAQYKHFVSTGYYNNPLAPGSIFSQCSGLLFGSCYLTAALYGLPLLIVTGNTIDVGRMITWLFSIATLVALWQIAKRYKVGAVLRAFGCLLLASTICFFITSHSARPDMLIGLTVLITTGCLPLIIKKHYSYRAVMLGLFVPFAIMVNGHVLIMTALIIGYLIWATGILKNKRLLIQFFGTVVAGFICLIVAQIVLLGSSSLLGPFSGASNTMPIMMLLHPRYDLGNFNWRLFIANAWAPGVVWVFGVLVAAILWARIRYGVRLALLDPVARRMIISVAFTAFASIFFEFHWPRYFIYVLPAIILSFMVVISYLTKLLRQSSSVVLGIALSACLVFALWGYVSDTVMLGITGKTITEANKTAVMEALSTIHSRHVGRIRIFSTVPGESISMDDSCELVTPIMYIQPSDTGASRDDLWKHAAIDYAIICNPAHNYDWMQTDSSIAWLARSRSQIIFERIGPFSDIGRSYNSADLKFLDTLRVYEFRSE
jgi:hypothetical protein